MGYTANYISGTNCHSINDGDNVFVRLIVNGKEKFCLNNRHYVSLNQIIATVANMAESLWGLAKLVVRNQTRGWSMEMPITLNMRPKHDERGQYLLFA